MLRVLLELRELKVIKDNLELMLVKVHKVLLVLKELLVLKVVMVHKVLWVHRVLLEQVLKDLLDQVLKEL